MYCDCKADFLYLKQGMHLSWIVPKIVYVAILWVYVSLGACFIPDGDFQECDLHPYRCGVNDCRVSRQGHI